MLNPFLTPMRRMAELVMAGYGFGLGAYIWGQAIAGHNALGWTSMSPDEAVTFGQIIATAGLVHALGIHINGRWIWSPFLRLAGMVVHLVVLTLMSVHGAGAHSTAGFTYPFIHAGFTAVSSFIGRDCASAIQRTRGIWKQN